MKYKLLGSKFSQRYRPLGGTLAGIWVQPENLILSYRKSEHPRYVYDCMRIQEYFNKALENLDVTDILAEEVKVVATDSHVRQE